MSDWTELKRLAEAATPDYAFTLLPYREGYDYQSFRLGERGFGFIGLAKGDEQPMVGLERCPKCDVENYCLAVLDCVCAWCGFDAKPFIKLGGKHE